MGDNNFVWNEQLRSLVAVQVWLTGKAGLYSGSTTLL